MKDAYAKAQQYARLGGKKLESVRKIADQNSEIYRPYFMDSKLYTIQESFLQIPYGKVKVDARVVVDWNV